MRRREVVAQPERMADLVRDDVTQVVVLLLEIAVHHALAQHEDVRVQDLPRQRIALDVRGRRVLAGRDPFDHVVVRARRVDAGRRVDHP